jgi:hypothetical protein
MAVLGGHLYTEGTEPSGTRFMVCHGGNWGHLYDLHEISYAATKKPAPSDKPRATLCVVGRAGLYREKMSGSAPVDEKIGISGAGYILDLRYIGSHLYACGVQNQVHRQVGDQWQRADQGTFHLVENQVDRIFESIDGFTEDNIYAAGKSGAIWHWDGQNWTQLESPTNYPFFSVVCASDGAVYVGGSNGYLFKGTRDLGWTDLSDESVTKQVLNRMCEFQGKIYITAENKLLFTDGGPIEEVDVPVKGHKAFYAIDSGSGVLWSVGDDCVLEFNGKVWKKHTCPENI